MEYKCGQTQNKRIMNVSMGKFLGHSFILSNPSCVHCHEPIFPLYLGCIAYPLYTMTHSLLTLQTYKIIVTFQVTIMFRLGFLLAILNFVVLFLL